MEEKWKILFPMLKGSCIISSTTNGLNWFWKMYSKAEQKVNNFSIFETNYLDYYTPAKIDDLKKSLGEKGFRQEILCEFLGEKPSSLNDIINSLSEEDKKWLENMLIAKFQFNSIP